MAVPAEAIAANERIFPRMLGLVRGRVYYNLLNWYRLLALLPGFSTNRRFMEQMMGVKEGIPEAILDEAVATYRVAPWRDRLNLVGSVIGLGTKSARSEEEHPAFLRTARHRPWPRPIPPLEEQRPDELVAHYRMLEAQAAHPLGCAAGQRFFRHGLLWPAAQADRLLVRRRPGNPAERPPVRRGGHDQRRTGPAGAGDGRGGSRGCGPDRTAGRRGCRAIRQGHRGSCTSWDRSTRPIWRSSATAVWMS